MYACYVTDWMVSESHRIPDKVRMAGVLKDCEETLAKKIDNLACTKFLARYVACLVY